jgi:hypothetical protein
MPDKQFYTDILDLFPRPGDQCYYHDYDYEVWDILLGERGDMERETLCEVGKYD